MRVLNEKFQTYTSFEYIIDFPEVLAVSSISMSTERDCCNGIMSKAVRNLPKLLGAYS